MSYLHLFEESFHVAAISYKLGNMLVSINVSINHLFDCFEAPHVDLNMFDICKSNCLICFFIHGFGLSSSTCPKIWWIPCRRIYIIGSQVFDESWKHRTWIKTIFRHLFRPKGPTTNLINIATLCSCLLNMRSIEDLRWYYFLLWACIWLFVFLAPNLVFLLDSFNSIKDILLKFWMCPKGNDDMVTSLQSNNMNDILPTLLKKNSGTSCYFYNL